MKLFARFLLMVLCTMPGVVSANVATTAGSNLTAWNGASGATNNNNWNQMMNSRTQATGGAGGAPVADFGNCNSVILRCAQPKCAGCTTIDVAWPIVQGCVNSNSSCKKHGDDLIQFIAAQIVSNASAKVQQQQMASQQAAAEAAAAQTNAQMMQMQQQMQMMQQQMQEQSAQQMQQMQAALDEQRRVTESAMNEANSAIQQQAAARAAAEADASKNEYGLTNAEMEAIDRGVGADILARKQISNQILTKIEQAELALKSLNATMQNVFTYAGCDTRGNNCTGPKRVKIFKQKAQQFFEPYDEIVDNAYEALEMALAVGVDVSDVIMMLSGACNQWGKFMCVSTESEALRSTGLDSGHEVGYYNELNCKNGRSLKGAAIRNGGAVKGGMECSIGMAIPPQDDTRCTLTSLIEGGTADIQREWMDAAYEGDRMVRVGCATSALETISIFGRRSSRSGNALDLETLERIILQDAPDHIGSNKYTNASRDEVVERVKYCALTSRGYQTLLTAVQSNKLPAKICVPYDSLAVNYRTHGAVTSIGSGTGLLETGIVTGAADQGTCDYIASLHTACGIRWDTSSGRCVVDTNKCVYKYGVFEAVESDRVEWQNKLVKCQNSGGNWSYSSRGRTGLEGTCNCPNVNQKKNFGLQTSGPKQDECVYCNEAAGKTVWLTSSGDCKTCDKQNNKDATGLDNNNNCKY